MDLLTFKPQSPLQKAFSRFKLGLKSLIEQFSGQNSRSIRHISRADLKNLKEFKNFLNHLKYFC